MRYILLSMLVLSVMPARANTPAQTVQYPNGYYGHCGHHCQDERRRREEHHRQYERHRYHGGQRY